MTKIAVDLLLNEWAYLILDQEWGIGPLTATADQWRIATDEAGRRLERGDIIPTF